MSNQYQRIMYTSTRLLLLILCPFVCLAQIAVHVPMPTQQQGSEKASVLPSAPSESEYRAPEFPQGSILSCTSSGQVEKTWELSTIQNLDQMQAVFDPDRVVSIEASKNNVPIPITERESPLFIRKAIVTDNVAHVRYNLQNGPIQKGDYITISSEAGVGMKATESGFTVGVALENSDAAEKPGLIKVRVMVRYERF